MAMFVLKPVKIVDSLDMAFSPGEQILKGGERGEQMIRGRIYAYIYIYIYRYPPTSSRVERAG